MSQLVNGSVVDELEDESPAVCYRIAEDVVARWVKNGKHYETLHLSYRHLTELPPLPHNLQRLCCEWNNLTALPPLPDTLIELDCSDNNIKELPPLPSGLRYLSCMNNPIEHIESLPQSLMSLHCSYFKFTTLPQLPDSLLVFDCINGPLEVLPRLPYRLHMMFVDHHTLQYPPPNSCLMHNINNIREWMDAHPYNIIKSAKKC